VSSVFCFLLSLYLSVSSPSFIISDDSFLDFVSLEAVQQLIPMSAEDFILKDASTRRLIIIILQGICFVLLLTVGILIIHSQKIKILNDMTRIQDVSDDLEIQRQLNMKFSHVLDETINTKIDSLAQLSEAYFRLDENFEYDLQERCCGMTRDEILSRFYKTLVALRDRDKTILLLEESLNVAENGLMELVRRDYTELKEQDYSLIVLFISGVSAKSIAYILEMSEAAVRMRKTRLKQYFLSKNTSEAKALAEKLYA
jgi:DNA-binding CsgD family transcriptional regulator